MKIWGALTVVAAFLGAALTRIRALKREFDCLRRLDASVRALRASLSSLQSPMPSLLRMAGEVADGETGLFYREAADGLTELNERSFSMIWEKAVDRRLSCLSEEERRSVRALGSYLGRFDLDEQLSACDRYLTENSAAIRRLADELPEKRRLYLALGGAAGVFLCLLIL